MIFRAIFWIGFVSLLMPHEPDLGLGRPSAGTSLPSLLSSWAVAGLSGSSAVCERNKEACAGGLGLIDTLQDHAVRTLADVKADLDANKKVRAAASDSDTPRLHMSRKAHHARNMKPGRDDVAG